MFTPSPMPTFNRTLRALLGIFILATGTVSCKQEEPVYEYHVAVRLNNDRDHNVWVEKSFPNSFRADDAAYSHILRHDVPQLKNQTTLWLFNDKVSDNTEIISLDQFLEKLAGLDPAPHLSIYRVNSTSSGNAEELFSAPLADCEITIEHKEYWEVSEWVPTQQIRRISTIFTINVSTLVPKESEEQ